MRAPTSGASLCEWSPPLLSRKMSPIECNQPCPSPPRLEPALRLTLACSLNDLKLKEHEDFGSVGTHLHAVHCKDPEQLLRLCGATEALGGALHYYQRSAGPRFHHYPELDLDFARMFHFLLLGRG